MKIKVSELKPHPFNALFGDLPKEEYTALREDIKQRGVQTIIDITEDNVIVCGHQRTKALRELGIEEVDVRVLKGWTDDRIKEHLIKDNVLRRQLTPAQVVGAGEELEKIYVGRQGERVDLLVDTCPQVDEKIGIKTRDLVAKDFGISGRTYDRYKTAAKIVNETKDEELSDKWVQGKAKAATIIREHKIEKQKEEIKKIEPKRAISGKYDVIVIDPPWPYGTKHDPDGRRISSPYPEMSIEKLKELDIHAADNCVLWLWTTNAFMKYAYELLDAWGFKDKTILTWDKQTIGIGYWLRNITEHCILAVKGKPVWDNKIHTTIISEKKTKHSTKPNAFYKMVDDICYGRTIEYFARKKRNGWDVYGDEVEQYNGKDKK